MLGLGYKAIRQKLGYQQNRPDRCGLFLHSFPALKFFDSLGPEFHVVKITSQRET